MISQTQKLYELLKDGKPHITSEIQRVVYGSEHLGLVRAGARIWDIKREYGVEIKGWKDESIPSLYWYQMIIKPEQGILFDMPETEREPSIIF